MQPLICIIPDLLAAHGLTGCDTVATCFGIGKAAALRVLTSGVNALTYVGDKSRILSEVTAHAKEFILACYGQTKCTLLTGVRQKMWANKVGQSEAGAPKLASLPPTNEAFNENVARAQTGSKQPVWKLFNMVTMTTINLKLIHHCYLIYVSQCCMPRKCEERFIH